MAFTCNTPIRDMVMIIMGSVSLNEAVRPLRIEAQNFQRHPVD